MSDVGGGIPAGFTFVEIRPLATRFNAQAAASVAPGLAAIDKAFDLKARSIEGRLQEVGKKASVFITLPAVIGLGAATKAASDLEEQTNKVGVVFGNNRKEVLAFSETSARSLGLSRRAALEAAGNFGNLFVSLGLGRAEAAKMSLATTKLGADLASFNNIEVGEVLTRLRSGLLGEQEAMERLGVTISETALKQKAFDLGLVNNTRSILPPQIKTLAAYQLIMDQTGTAQGDFARTSDRLANRLRVLRAELEDAAAKLGEKLIPVALKLVNIGTQLIDVFDSLPEPVQNLVLIGTVAAAAAGPVLYLTGKVIQLRNALRALNVESALGAAGKAAAGRAAVGAGAAAAGAAAGGAASGAGAAVGAGAAGALAARLGVAGLAAGAAYATAKVTGLDKAVISLEEKIPVVGKALGALDRWVFGVGKSSERTTVDLGRLAVQAAGLNRLWGGTATLFQNVSGQVDSTSAALGRYQTRLEAVFGQLAEGSGAQVDFLSGVADLERNLAERAGSTNDLRRAQLDAIDAQQRLNEARKTGVSATRAIQDAERDLARAERKAAEVHFNALRRGADPEAAVNADEAVSDARRRLEDARRVDAHDVERAQLDLEEARKREAEEQAKSRRQPILGTNTAEQRETLEIFNRTLAGLKGWVDHLAEIGAIANTDQAKVATLRDHLDGLAKQFPALRPRIDELRGQLDAAVVERPASIVPGVKEDALAIVKEKLDALRQPIVVPVQFRVDLGLGLGTDTGNALTAGPRMVRTRDGLRPAQPTGDLGTASAVGDYIDQRTINNTTNLNTGSLDERALAELLARAQARDAARAR